MMPRHAITRSLSLAALLVILPTTHLASPPPPSLPADLVERVVAFATLLDAVRYYHPSAASAQAREWNAVAQGAAERAAERALFSPEPLGPALEAAFAELAPTLRIHRSGETPEPVAELAQTASEGREILLWRHVGSGVPQRDANRPQSERLGSASSSLFANLAQSLPAAPWRGRRVRLEARARLRDVEPSAASFARAQLFLRVDRAGQRRGFFDAMEDRPIRAGASGDGSWQHVVLEGEVDADAEQIVVGAVLFGPANLLLDELDLTVLPPPQERRGPALANGRFEEGEGDRQPPGWTFPYDAIRQGYRFVHQRGALCAAGDCAEIIADAGARLRFYPPARTTEIELGAGWVAALPTRLYRARKDEISRIDATAAVEPASPLARRAVTLASLWGSLAHFCPALETRQDEWREALVNAAADPALAGDDGAFLHLLERLVAASGDLAAAVWAPDDDDPYLPPIDWLWLGGELVIRHAGADSGLRAGEIVATIDGRPAAERLSEMESRTAVSTPEAHRARALARLLRGPQGSELRLGIEGHGGRREVRLERGSSALFYLASDRPPLAELEPGIWYLDLRRLSDAEIARAMPSLEKARFLIADARGAINTGNELLAHLIDHELPSSNWQRMVTTEPFQRDARPISTFWSLLPKPPRLSARVAFLTDERARGYSETVLAIVEAFRLGQIVGSPTAGSNGSLTTIELPGGYRAQFTSMRVIKHDGTPLQGAGIRPTLSVVPTRAGLAAGRDEVLEAALALLKGGRP